MCVLAHPDDESLWTGGKLVCYARPTVLAALLIWTGVACGRAPAPFPGESWQYRSPPELGLDSAVLDRFVERVQSSGRDAGVIVKDGYVVKMWGDTAARVDWASAGKSALSTMLLFALAEGRLSSLDEPVLGWGWDDTTDPARRLQGMDRAITFRHLANMTSGLDRIEGPGEAYAYNDNAVQLYARTLMRVFDAETSPTAFNAAAMAPGRLGLLGFEDGPLFGTTDPLQAHRAETSLVTSPRDLARLGWFWLNKGNWRGRQVLPESLFEQFVAPLVSGNTPLSIAATQKYLRIGTWGNPLSFDIPFGPGIYGLHWWFNGVVGASDRRHWPDTPLDTFAAIGNYPDKMVVVIPSRGLVVVGTGDWSAGTLVTPPLDGSRGQPHRYWDPGDATGALNQQFALLASAVQ